jgi:phosphoribosylamine-glycine ligase
MFQWAKSNNYTGPLDMAFFLGKDDKPYFLEFTPRFGINAVYGLWHAMRGDLGKYLLDVTLGRAKEAPVAADEFQFIQNISIPPYPYDIKKWQVYGQPVEFKTSDHYKVWYFDVVKKDKDIVTLGLDGLIAAVSATGSRKELQANIDGVKNYLKKTDITNKQYRVDGGDQIEGLKYLEKGRFL